MWWGALEKMRWHGGNTLLKVAADQLLYAPYIVGSCLALATALKDPAAATTSVPETMATDYIPTLLTSYCVWPVVNGLNFRFVPLDYRILVQNVASFGWNLYLVRHPLRLKILSPLTRLFVQSWVVHRDRDTCEGGPE